MKLNIFYQDNESAIKMEKNGIGSASNKLRHINIRYFFIKDIIQRERLMVKHCPTEIMIADYLTKPTQGTLFKKLRDILMGIAPFPMEEHVEYPIKSIAKGGNTTGGNVGQTKSADKTSDVGTEKDTNRTSTNTVSMYKSKLLDGREKKEEDNGRQISIV